MSRGTPCQRAATLYSPEGRYAYGTSQSAMDRSYSGHFLLLADDLDMEDKCCQIEKDEGLETDHEWASAQPCEGCGGCRMGISAHMRRRAALSARNTRTRTLSVDALCSREALRCQKVRKGSKHAAVRVGKDDVFGQAQISSIAVHDASCLDLDRTAKRTSRVAIPTSCSFRLVRAVTLSRRSMVRSLFLSAVASSRQATAACPSPAETKCGCR